jgi:hypothetical protein
MDVRTAISPLRRRMIEKMTFRKLASKTHVHYAAKGQGLAAFLGRSPATASKEDVRRYQPHLASIGAQTPKINSTVSALRFLFDVTLNRSDLATQASFVYEPRKLLVVLSPEEGARMLEAEPGIKYKAGAECLLRCRAARLRRGLAEGVRHRLPTHDAARRTRQDRARSAEERHDHRVAEVSVQRVHRRRISADKPEP